MTWHWRDPIHGKCRVKKDGENWYKIEWKPNDETTEWKAYLVGTKEWLDLSDKDIEWAK